MKITPLTVASWLRCPRRVSRRCCRTVLDRAVEARPAEECRLREVVPIVVLLSNANDPVEQVGAFQFTVGSPAFRAAAVRVDLLALTSGFFSKTRS